MGSSASKVSEGPFAESDLDQIKLAKEETEEVRFEEDGCKSTMSSFTHTIRGSSKEQGFACTLWRPQCRPPR